MVAEKLSALETEDFFKRRAKNAKPGAFLAFLDGAGDEPPGEGDLIEHPHGGVHEGPKAWKADEK